MARRMVIVMGDMCRDAVADIRTLMHTIRERRLRLHITIVEMAEQIGVSQGAYYQWECGGTFPSSRKLAAACRVVGLKMTVAHADPTEMGGDL